MINIFNRTELTATFSIKKQSELRSSLAAADIDYKCKVINRKSPSALNYNRTGTLCENLDTEYEYIFYVKKNDRAAAQKLVQL